MTRRDALLYAAALLAGTYLTFRPTFDSGFGRLQSDPGDTLLNHYTLEHTWTVLTDPGYRGTLYTAPFFHPTPLTVAYSESLLGAAPVYWLLRVVLPADLAFQWWTILLDGLNFVAFAAVCRWVGCGPPAAALGGYLWAFAGVHVELLGHEQLIPRFWVPLAVYHAWRLAEAPAVRPLNRALGCLFLQAAACFYTGWFLAGGLAVFVPAAAAARPGGLRDLGRFARANRGRVAAVVGLWAGGLVVFFTPYFVAHRGYARTYEECVEYLPTAGGWYRLFPGFAAAGLALAAAVSVLRRRADRPPEARLIAAALAAAAVWWVLTLGVADRSLWEAVRVLPGGAAVRAVFRVYLVVDALAGLAAVVWLDRAVRRVACPRRRRTVWAVVWAAVVGGGQVGDPPRSVPKYEFYPWVERRAAVLRGADAAYVLPRQGTFWVHDEVFAMWIGLRANVPVVNGYSGRTPAGYKFADREHPDADLRRVLAGRFRGRVAVLDPYDKGPVRFIEIE